MPARCSTTSCVPTGRSDRPGKGSSVSQEITQAHCNRCGHSTKHDILASDKEDWEYWGGTEKKGDDGYFLHEMLKCRGCGSVTLRLTTQYPNDGPPTVVYYPRAVARRTPEWVWPDITNITLAELGLMDDPPPIPFPIVNLMREIYAAVQNGLTRLAAMGIRDSMACHIKLVRLAPCQQDQCKGARNYSHEVASWQIRNSALEGSSGDSAKCRIAVTSRPI